MQTKLCSSCKNVLPLSEFYARPERDGRPKYACKPCHRSAMKAYRKANPEKVKASQKRTVAKKPEHYKALARKSYLRQVQRDGASYTERDWAAAIRRDYGLTVEEYQKMFTEQGGACAICRKKTEYRLHVDHNHGTGLVRALLCKHCNFGIAHFFEDRYTLQQAIEYLTKHQPTEEPCTTSLMK